MSWWEVLIFIAVVILAVWGFASIVGLQTRNLTRRTRRSAQDLYGNYADSPRKQRRYAREHGGEWRNDR
jgi:type II secretory pathway component PulL